MRALAQLLGRTAVGAIVLLWKERGRWPSR